MSRTDQLMALNLNYLTEKTNTATRSKCNSPILPESPKCNWTLSAVSHIMIRVTNHKDTTQSTLNVPLRLVYKLHTQLLGMILRKKLPIKHSC